MKVKFAFVVIAFLLGGCSIFRPNPPSDLVEQLREETLDFKVVDSYKFPLSDADKRNNVTAKWCVAYTASSLDVRGLYSPYGIAFLEAKIGNGWVLIDAMPFTEYELYPASKTSCKYLKDKYLP